MAVESQKIFESHSHQFSPFPFSRLGGRCSAFFPLYFRSLNNPIWQSNLAACIASEIWAASTLQCRDTSNLNQSPTFLTSSWPALSTLLRSPRQIR